jgi:hypothetical protein
MSLFVTHTEAWALRLSASRIGVDFFERRAELAVAPEPAPLRRYVSIRAVARAR